MTVEELMVALSELPKEAVVKFRQDFIGDEHFIVQVKYDDKYKVAWLFEMHQFNGGKQ